MKRRYISLHACVCMRECLWVLGYSLQHCMSPNSFPVTTVKRKCVGIEICMSTCETKRDRNIHTYILLFIWNELN